MDPGSFWFIYKQLTYLEPSCLYNRCVLLVVVFPTLLPFSTLNGFQYVVYVLKLVLVFKSKNWVIRQLTFKRIHRWWYNDFARRKIRRVFRVSTASRTLTRLIQELGPLYWNTVLLMRYFFLFDTTEFNGSCGRINVNSNSLRLFTYDLKKYFSKISLKIKDTFKGYTFFCSSTILL